MNFFYIYYKYYRDNKKDVHNSLTILKKKYNIDEIFLLATCHRFELYLIKNGDEEVILIKNAIKVLEKIFGKDLFKYKKYIESSDKIDSIKHLLATAVGIDSVIIGEVDVIDQIKEAQNFGDNFNNISSELNEIIEFVYDFGKKMRVKTGIEKGITSYASIPFEYLLDSKINIYNRKYFVFGAGMLGKRVVRDLLEKGIENNNIFLLNRNYEKALSFSHENNIVALDIKYDFKNFLKGDEVIVTCSAGGTLEYLNNINKIENKNFIIFDFGLPSNVPEKLQKNNFIKYLTLNDFRSILVKDSKKKKNIKSLLKNYIHEKVINLKI
jgi:glutamyl-tRNA reductase